MILSITYLDDVCRFGHKTLFLLWQNLISKKKSIRSYEMFFGICHGKNVLLLAMKTAVSTFSLAGNQIKHTNPPVYLHLIFEVSSFTLFFQFLNTIKFKKSSLIRNRFFFEFVINSQIDISKIKHR